jgi:hypothetical protein
VTCAEEREAKGRCGEPSSGLTLGGEAVRWASGSGEQISVVALGVRGTRGEESWGHGLEGWWWGLPYIGSGRRGGGWRGGERSAEVWFKGGELRGQLSGRGRGGVAG